MSNKILAKFLALTAVLLFVVSSSDARQRVLTNGSRCGCDTTSEHQPKKVSQPKKKTKPASGPYRAAKTKKKKRMEAQAAAEKQRCEYTEKTVIAVTVDDDDENQGFFEASKNGELLECPNKSRRAYRAAMVELALPHKPKKEVPTKVRRPRRYRVDLSQKDKPDYSQVTKTCYATLAYGFTKYLVPQEFWYTAHTAEPQPETRYDALMSVNRTSMMPLIRGAMGFQFDEVPCLFMKNVNRLIRLGIEVSFAKKRNAFKATFTDFYGAAPGPRTIYQDVTRGTVMFVGNFGIMNKRSLGINFDMGVGLVGGALKNLRLYDFGTYYSQGQTVPVNKIAAGGFLGLTFLRFFEQTGTDLEASYRVVFSKVQYANYIVQTIAEPGSVAYTNPAAYSSPLYLAYTVGRNHLRVYSNEFTLALTKNF